MLEFTTGPLYSYSHGAVQLADLQPACLSGTFTEPLLHTKKFLGTQKYLRPRPGLEGLGIQEANRKGRGSHKLTGKLP